MMVVLLIPGPKVSCYFHPEDFPLEENVLMLQSTDT